MMCSPWLFTGHFGGRCCDRNERHLEQKGHHMPQDMVEYQKVMEYSWIGMLSAKDKAINWKALELPLASQIKGLAILQEEGGEVSRCMSGFWTVRLI